MQQWFTKTNITTVNLIALVVKASEVLFPLLLVLIYTEFALDLETFSTNINTSSYVQLDFLKN